MNELKFQQFCFVLSLFQEIDRSVRTYKEELGPQAKANDGEIRQYSKILKKLAEECNNINLLSTANQIEQTLWFLNFDPLGVNDRSYPIIETRFRVIRETFVREANERKFLWIKKEFSEFIDCDDLFGPEISKCFPSAKEDIKAAGNCMAADCNTAAVFHLMRAVEWGLRAFCVDIGFKEVCINKKKKKL